MEREIINKFIEWKNSTNRKPLIIYKDEIIYGYRSLLNAIYFLFEIINNATFKARSKKMKIYLGIINKQSGEDFNEKVYNYLCTFPNSIVDKKVSKINGIKINDSDKNTLGDIDVLFISKKFRVLILRILVFLHIFRSRIYIKIPTFFL